MIVADEAEKKLHLGAIHSLSKQLHAPMEDVAQVYEMVLAEATLRARIKDYLTILVSRRVKGAFKAGGEP